MSNTSTELAVSIKAAISSGASFHRDVEARANMVRSGQIPIDGVAQAYREAVEQLLRGPNAGAMPDTRAFHAKQRQELLQHLQDLKAAGHVFHGMSQEASDELLRRILDAVDSGVAPDVPALLQEYAETNGLSPEWAGYVAKRAHPKQTRKSLERSSGHKVLTEAREAGMLSKSFKAALHGATPPGLGDIIFKGSKLSRRVDALEAQMDELKARLAAAESSAAFANARLDMKDAGKDWREAARSILAVEPGISLRKLAERVGVGESTVRKYRSDLQADAA